MSLFTASGNVKRVLEIFRGVRNLDLANDESFGAQASGKANRAAAGTDEKTINDYYKYTAVIGHRDVNGRRVEYNVLWSDSSLTWVDAVKFERDVIRAEGRENNTITRYEHEVAEKVRRAQAKARKPTRAGATFSYHDIRNHRNDAKGNRSHYEVVWDTGETTWEPSATLRRDVEAAEGQRSNIITAYEARVRAEERDLRAQAGKKPTIAQAREFATWVERTQALELKKDQRVRADNRLAVLPRVPSLLPWSVRSPLTTAAGRMKAHDLLLYAKHWAPLHLRGLLKDDVYAILIAYFAFLSRLTARSITQQEASELEEVAGRVLSELELVLPVTELAVLVHVLVHVPKQLAWFGPACTTWMFSFER
jgi:hypothetical protein